MNKSFQFVLVFTACLCACSPRTNTSSTKTDLVAGELQPYGRSVLQDNGNLELISSGVHFGVRFLGSECKIYANNLSEGGHGYLQYVVDGVYKGRVRIEGKSQLPVVVSANGNGPHSLWVYKATEAQTGAIVIHKITGQGLVAIPKPKLPLIEFIGNSITCGAAADASEIACGAGQYHDQHNAYDAYGPRVARALGTEFLLSSVSGIGIYRNWNSDGPIMPQVYEKTALVAGGALLWDFKQYDPKVVSIALGTNDFSNGDGVKKRLPFDSAKFVNNYIQFVQLVKSKYPSATIALLSSPMMQGSKRETLQNCLYAVKQAIDALYGKSKPVSLHFFKPMQARGCSGHPSVEDHGIMAEELVGFFKALM